MAAAEDFNGGWVNTENDALIGRLRDLQWPQIQPELRSRCWEQFSELMSAKANAEEAVEETPPTRNVGEHYACSRRAVPLRSTVAERFNRGSSPRAVLAHRAPALSFG